MNGCGEDRIIRFEKQDLGTGYTGRNGEIEWMIFGFLNFLDFWSEHWIYDIPLR